MEMLIVNPESLEKLIIYIIFTIFSRTLRYYFFTIQLTLNIASPTLLARAVPTIIMDYRNIVLTSGTVSLKRSNLLVWITYDKIYSSVVGVKQTVEFCFLELGMVAKGDNFSIS